MNDLMYILMIVPFMILATMLIILFVGYMIISYADDKAGKTNDERMMNYEEKRS